MLATIGENGRFGVVAVGNSPAEAQALYEKVQEVVTSEAREAIKPRPLPEP